MVKHELNFRKALQNPRATFGSPNRVLADPRLDREGKRAILRCWERDERELAVAAEEGMTEGEPGMLRDVLLALDRVTDHREVPGSTQTKHGGHHFTDDESSGNRPANLVKDLMRPVTEVVHLDQDLCEANTRMRHNAVTFLPVVDGDEIVGILTARNIYAEPALSGPDSEHAKVRDHLSKEFAFCYLDDDIHTAQVVIDQSGHHCLLVINGDNRLVGLITLDIISAALRHRASASSSYSRSGATGRLAKASGRAKGAAPGVPRSYSVSPKIRKA